MSFDVIVIGTGAGGGTLARALAPGGLKVLLIERGDFLPREKANWRADEVFRRHRYHNAEPWLDGAGRPFQPVCGYHVGGDTRLYGAAVLRRRESDFDTVRHAGGDTVAWPIRYADLAPYYDVAERWYFAHGLRGEDPTEPEAAAFPGPPFRHDPAIEEVFLRLRDIGLHPFHLPLALHLDEARRERSPCIRCDTCDGFPCLVAGKGDAEMCGVRPALAHPNVTLRTGLKAVRLETSGDGRRVVAVCCEGGGATESFRGRVVVVAAGAINSAALLLASASGRHPRGLANGSDQVGRNYMCHINSVMLGLRPGRANGVAFQKTIGVNDFYRESGDPAFPWPLGHVQLLGKVTGEILKAQRPYLPRTFTDWFSGRSVDWWLTTEDLASPANRITLTPSGQIRVACTPNNLEAHHRLIARWRRVLRRIGFPLVFTQTMGIEAVAHQVGTVRFGRDPATSVLDPHCRAHELDNLFVVDGGFMPSISAVNPSLTIMAQALRAAGHIRARFAEGTWAESRA
ncbi:MAG: GMC family oxidoreductase [Gammaproteobacteria bacterium]|nr:GMC family oxidoreductase [Gammaproteobacteria bacterium]